MTLQDTHKYKAWLSQLKNIQVNFIQTEKEKIEKMVLRKTVEVATPFYHAKRDLENLSKDCTPRERFFALRKFLMAREAVKDVTNRLSKFDV